MTLEKRMFRYKNISNFELTPKTPVIIKVDGQAFHTYLSKIKKKGFHKDFHEIMYKTAIKMCEKIMNVKIAETHSDEISLLLTDYVSIKTDTWFSNRVQKMASSAASLASVWFNYYLHQLDEFKDYPLATFDGCCWNLPKEEVINYFIWRQQDATRNAIQMLGQLHFSHNELHGVNCNQIQEKLFTKGINFNDIDVEQKRGVCIIKEEFEKDDSIRHRWIVDYNIPIFTKDRNYIEKYVIIKDSE